MFKLRCRCKGFACFVECERAIKSGYSSSLHLPTEAHLESITSSTSHLVVKVIFNDRWESRLTSTVVKVEPRDRVEENMESQERWDPSEKRRWLSCLWSNSQAASATALLATSGACKTGELSFYRRSSSSPLCDFVGACGTSFVVTAYRATVPWSEWVLKYIESYCYHHQSPHRERLQNEFGRDPDSLGNLENPALCKLMVHFMAFLASSLLQLHFIRNIYRAGRTSWIGC